MSDNCIFCQLPPEEWAEEHVTPQWLQDHLSISAQDQMFQNVASAADNSARRPRVHASRRFVEGRVCKICNEGWMSRLESKAKPTLIELIEGNRPVSLLEGIQAAIVAKWMVKTAYVLANASVGKRPVPAPHLKALEGDDFSMHEGVGVFAMQANYNQPISYLQSATWPRAAFGATTDDIKTPEAAYKLGLQYRHLYFAVVLWHTSPLRFAIAAGQHIPIWPRSLPWLAYVNHEQSSDQTSLPVLKHFANSVAVFLP